MDLSLAALDARYRAGARVDDLVDSLLERWLDAPGGIWIDPPDPTRLHRDARALDAIGADERASMPLFGVPIAVKDNIDVVGFPTTAGCPAFDRRPSVDATTVARLRAAGALIVAKTNLDQFATGLTGTRTPYGVAPNVFDPTLVPGGSSSGSAVGVALGLVTAALGTDTAGSGRVPAACNGLVGWKPTPRTWPDDGVVPACRSLDCVSVFAKTVTDAAAVAQVVGAAPVVARGGSLRVAVADNRARAGWQRATADAYAAAVAEIVANGHQIVPVDLDLWYDVGALLYEGPWVAERTAAVGEFIAAHPDEVEPVVRDIVLGGGHFDAVAVFRALERLEGFATAARSWWSRADVLVLPTVDEIPTVTEALADPAGTSRRLGRLTNAANLLGLAAVSLPAGLRSDGRPFGITAFAPAQHRALLHGFVSISETQSSQSEPPYDLAVVGAHLSGLELNHRLTDRGARLLTTTTTSDRYRLYHLDGGPVPRPGLERVERGGRAIEVEVWRLDGSGFAAVVAEVPPPLAIGAIELADGRWVRGFVCEPIGLHGARDISANGGWRAYRDTWT